MNRLIKHLATATVVLGFSGAVACTTANTAPKHVDPTPTPAPTPKFTNGAYAKALRTASIKLRNKPPLVADTQAVLAGGQPVYEALLDGYLDPAQDVDLGPQLRNVYNAMFSMGGTADFPVAGVPQPYNLNEASNLAVFAVLNDKPVSELLTANYCVGNNFQQPAMGSVVDGSTADAMGCAIDGTPADQRAGVISQKSFLAFHGDPSTVNMRRMSVIHQLFNCGIYPDGGDVPLARTNDTTHDAADPANTNPACSVVGCPDNSGECSGSNMFPCNNNDTTADATDDFADPALGLVMNDPPTPKTRISKKYQSKLKGGVGLECHDCHGSLNARRPVMIPYDSSGIYDPARTTADVETPDVNGAKDYCGLATPADPTDDIDTSSDDCLNGAQPVAQYHGAQITSLKQYGLGILNQPQFYSCMTSRHYDFVLGKGQGLLGLQAAGGQPPPALDPAILTKYKLVYESSGWNTRELLRTMFKGDEFLSSQPN